MQTNKIYCRLFDVDWYDESNFLGPLASISKIENMGFEIVPTVFITNESFVKIADNQLDTLANLIYTKISKHIDVLSFSEIQIDCDWTEKTKEKYFEFIKKFKKTSQKGISVTLRLHQIKYTEKSGIPPADRGMLMAYNMGNLDNPESGNSILDIPTINSYVYFLKKYPLPADVAMPIFRWGVVTRDGEAVKIVNNIGEETFKNYDTVSVLKKIKINTFQVLKNTYFEGFYLYKNDEIRLEEVPLSILQQSADILTQNIDNQELTVAFYHLDSALLKRFSYENLQDIVHRFR